MSRHTHTRQKTVYNEGCLEVRATHRYGKGVFAKRYIRQGEVIHVLSGQTMTIWDLVKKVTGGREFIDDPLQIGRRTYIDLDKFSRLFNHSCTPNSGLRKRSELFAITDIKKGAQICFDYSTTIAPTKWEMQCRCGSKNCRKIIGDVRSIPKRQLEYYKAHHALQRYIRDVINEIAKGIYVIPDYEKRALRQLASI